MKIKKIVVMIAAVAVLTEQYVIINNILVDLWPAIIEAYRVKGIIP